MLGAMGINGSAQGASFTLSQGALLQAGLSSHFVAYCALYVAIVLLWTVAFGVFFERCIKIPAIAGNIIGGILLGPSWGDIASWNFFEGSFSVIDGATNSLYLIPAVDLYLFFVVLISSCFTVSYLLWTAGHETDIQETAKVGVVAIAAGVLGALVPVGMVGLCAYYWFGYSTVQAVSLGLIFSATSVSIPVAMLITRNKMQLRSSKATLGAAIVDDIFAVILLSVFFIAVQSGTFGSIAGYAIEVCQPSLWQAFASMIGACVVMIGWGMLVTPFLVNVLQNRGYAYLTVAFAHGTMLLYCAFSELIGGLAGMTGAYFAGLFHKGSDDKHRAEKAITPFVDSLLLPLFLGSIGLQIDLHSLSVREWGYALGLLGIAVISKVVACYGATALGSLGARDGQAPWSLLESYIFGSSMVARGEVGLVVAMVLKSASLLSQDQYVLAVVVIVLTTIISPIMLSIGFSYQDGVSKTPHKGVPFSLSVGTVKHMGTATMFAIIVHCLEEELPVSAVVHMSEGKRIATFADMGIKVIFSHQNGITVEGDREQIEPLFALVMQKLQEDVHQIHSGVR